MIKLSALLTEVTPGGGVITSGSTNITHLVIQRPVSDLALYPYVEASESPDYDDSLEIDLYDDFEGNSGYCKVFNGDSWMDIPKSGLGTPFDGMEVEIELTKFEGLSQPYYLRYGWVTSDGAYSNYKGLVYPSVSGGANKVSTSSSKELARQSIITESTISTLYLDSNIIIQNTTIGDSLSLDISSIIDTNGKEYTGSSGDVFTWELWVTSTSEITSFTLGGTATIIKLNTFPTSIPLIDNNTSRHVLALRAVYDSKCNYNLKFLLNYCYSEAL